MEQKGRFLSKRVAELNLGSGGVDWQTGFYSDCRNGSPEHR